MTISDAVAPMRTQQPFSRCPDCHKKGVQFRFAEAVAGEDGYGCRYCDFWFFTGSRDTIDAERRARWEWANPEPTMDPQWRHAVWPTVEDYAYQIASGDEGWTCSTCDVTFWRHEMPGWDSASDLEQRELGARNYLRAHAHRLEHGAGDGD